MKLWVLDDLQVQERFEVLKKRRVPGTFSEQGEKNEFFSLEIYPLSFKIKGSGEAMDN